MCLCASVPLSQVVIHPGREPHRLCLTVKQGARVGCRYASVPTFSGCHPSRPRASSSLFDGQTRCAGVRAGTQASPLSQVDINPGHVRHRLCLTVEKGARVSVPVRKRPTFSGRHPSRPRASSSLFDGQTRCAGRVPVRKRPHFLRLSSIQAASFIVSV